MNAETTGEPFTWRVAARYALITLVALLAVALYRIVLHVNQTTVALTFLVLVLLVATRWRLATLFTSRCYAPCYITFSFYRRLGS